MKERRRRDVSAGRALVCAAAVLAALVLSAPACGGSGDGSTATTQTTVTSRPSTPAGNAGSTASSASTTTPAPSTTVASGPTTTEKLSTAETRLPNGRIRAMGFIQRVWEEGGTRYISIDLAEMLSGKEAQAAAVEDGEIPAGETLPNDYYIRNRSPQLRQFTVSPNATITTASYGGSNPHTSNWDEFVSFWSSSPPSGAEYMRDVPWWIERYGDEVQLIEEQYLP